MNKAYNSNINGKKHLFEIANEQEGFFTAKQAEESGVDKRNFSYHVKAGNWVREGHGIYRLAQYPLSESAQLILIWFWTRDRKSDKPEGVFSHETAFKIFNLTDLMPTKIHLTVSRKFRRSGTTPPGIILHKEEAVSHMKVGVVEVARPLQAIVQVIEADSQPIEIITQAFEQANQMGIIKPQDFDNILMKPETLKIINVLRAKKI